MPRISPHTSSWVFQRLELQSTSRKADTAAVCQQALLICRDQMGHRVALPSMAVKPQPAIHCEDHPVSAANKLPIDRRGVRNHAGAFRGIGARTTDRRSNPRSKLARVPARSR